jgi:hypothetical protein
MQAYPLTLTFDRGTILGKLIVKNAQGSPVMQAERSLTLKSKFEVCAYQKYRQDHYTILAPKLMSWQMHYDFWNNQGESIGRIQSASKSPLKIYAGERLAFGVNLIRNPYRQLSIIPTGVGAIGVCCLPNSLPNIVTFGWCLLILAFLSTVAMSLAGLSKESYRVQHPDGRTVMQFARSNMQQFRIDALNALNEAEETAVLLGVLLLIFQDQDASNGD